MQVVQVRLKNGTVLGIRIDLNIAPILVMKADKGFVMCGYLNIDAAEKMGDVAARVSGVRTFEDVLEARINQATTKANGLGIKEGMTGREALELLF